MSEEGFKRRLSAILSADVKGYSRLMRDDEDETIRTITAYRTSVTKLVQQYRGRVVDSPGDNILSEFTSVVDAVNCAVEIQRELAEQNAELPENRRMQFRIGVNSGDIVEEGERIYGDGVNIAARIEGLAEGGGICISGTVYDSIEGKLGLEFEYLGEHEVKNIDKPIRVYRVLSYPGAAAHRLVKAKKAVGKTWRNIMMAIAVVFVLGVALAVWHFYFRPPPIERASLEKMAYSLKELGVQRKAAGEKALEEELKRLKAEKKELEMAKIKELVAKQKMAEEKARKEAAEKKALEEERKHLEDEKKKLEVAKLPPKPKYSPPVSIVEEIGREATFIAYSNGVVYDSKTRLEWIAGPDKDTTWDEARTWVNSLSIAGGGWGMPKMDELRTLYEEGAGTRHITPLLKTTGWFVWSTSYVVSFNSIQPIYSLKVGEQILQMNSSSDARGFAVRSSKQRISSISPTNLEIKEIARDGHFIAYNNETVSDKQTGLMWAAKDDGEGIFGSYAKAYCRDFRGGGYSDWRMPTVDEMRTIFDRNIKNQHGYHITKLIDITNEWVLTLDRWDSVTCFNFYDGSSITHRHWPHFCPNNVLGHVLPVRDGK